MDALSGMPSLAGVEHRIVNAGGLAMHVAEAGSGEPLVMLHGWPQHWWCWRYVIPRLAERYRVICPDLRGHGWTEAPAHGYEKEQLAGDVLNLLDALELERVRLVGHDWGGWAGFLLCLREPARVERFLALNIIHPWPPNDPRNLLSAWRVAYQWLLGAPMAGPALLRRFPERLVGAGLRRSAQRSDAFSAEDLRIFADRFRDPARAEATAQLYRTFQLREQLPVARGRYRSQRLVTPTLLLFGVADQVIPVRMLRGYEPYAHDMTVELVESAGHFIAEDAPDLVVDRALRFFASPDTQSLGPSDPGTARGNAR